MTQETTHTPKPWNWRGPWKHLAANHVLDSENIHVFRVLHDYETNEWEDAAARIVACVNACEGMADPAAEIAALRARVAELEKGGRQ